MSPDRIHLSPPHLGPDELRLVVDALASNWIAPAGPELDAFEREFARTVGAHHALATSSGTAALHLALRVLGVERGDDVVVSTFTFAGSVFPICYLGARPVFVDSERASWNLDPELLGEHLRDRARAGRLPKAVIVVHLYGQTADLTRIAALCQAYDVPLIEDAAEALGATHEGRMAGSVGTVGTYSFNGNKIITTSAGGMLVAADPGLVERARKLANQAREDVEHYEHLELGYNYRMSNLLAAVGRGQLRVLEERVAARRANFAAYHEALGDLPGVTFMPEASWGRHTRWLTTLTIDPTAAHTDGERVRRSLERANIEARPLWKPMHQQPVFAHCDRVGGAVADELFARGLCLPSGSNLSETDRERVTETLRAAFRVQAGSR